MGRRQLPIKDTGPIGVFAGRLRARHTQAEHELGRRLTFRDLSKETSYSHSVLARAESGEELPTWPLVEKLLDSFGVVGDEKSKWHEFHTDTTSAVINLQRKNGDLAVAVFTGDGDLMPISGRTTRLQPVRAAAADPARQKLAPESVHTFDDLRLQLEVLRIRVGNPPLRFIAAHASWASVSTLGEVFSGRRRPKFETLCSIAEALTRMQRANRNPFVDPLPSQDAWQDAWYRAEFNRTRPDLTRTRGYDNVYLLREHQDEGPTATVIGEMKPSVAAALLASMPPKVSSGILGELVSSGRAQPIIEAMVKLTGKANPEPPGGISLVTTDDTLSDNAV